jgi:hypothetical protein
MRVGVQFTGSVAANASSRWFTHSWPPDWNVVWTVVPTTPAPGAPQIEWDVEVQRASATAITYWIEVRNLTAAPVSVEGRFVVVP